MKVQTPPGMRDFYPDDMRLQNWLFDHWRQAARAFGFQEYEAPIFEFLDLYRIKSGEGIVSELFHFRDRGEREFAIRPEMTPSLARMVAARANALPRPIKWFSLPRMCRAEKPQRGRLREFFQWNVDVLGVDDPLADAEVIACAVAFFRAVGLTAADVVVRLNSRPFAASFLESYGIPAERHEQAFGLIDRHEKLGDAFADQWNAAFGPAVKADELLQLLGPQAAAEAFERVAARTGASQRSNFEEVRLALARLGVDDYIQFDLGIVRGLAYYTGVVFEAHARKPGLRALLGGGRYDDLTGLLDGPRVPGIGFGMGDAPVLECLRELGKLPGLADELDAFVIDADAGRFEAALRIVGDLRQAGLRADFSYKRQNVGKQLKQAAQRRAQFAVIVGAELDERGVVALKNLGSGEQQECPPAELPATMARAQAAGRST